MLRLLLSGLMALAAPASLRTDADSWLQTMSAAQRMMEDGHPEKAVAVMRPLLATELSDEQRAQTLYTLGIAAGQQGDDAEAATRLEQAFELMQATIPDQTGRLASTLMNWRLALERTGDTAKAARVDELSREIAARLVAELWAHDETSDTWVHRPSGIRFPERFGALHRQDMGFDNPMGSDAKVIYALKPPGRGKVIVLVQITDRTPREGLDDMSNRAVAMLGLEDASYREATFRVADERKPTGVRRLWPFFEQDGLSWSLETFFVARGPVHISLFKLCTPDDVYETGESMNEMLSRFDWPAHPF